MSDYGDPTTRARERVSELLKEHTPGRFWFAVTNDPDRVALGGDGLLHETLYETKMHLAAMEMYIALQQVFEVKSTYKRPKRIDKETLPHIGPYSVCVVWESQR